MRKEEHAARALLLRLKPDGGCLSNACVCEYMFVWTKKSKKEGGLNQYLGVFFRCQGGAREEEC